MAEYFPSIRAVLRLVPSIEKKRKQEILSSWCLSINDLIFPDDILMKHMISLSLTCPRVGGSPQVLMV